MKGQRIYLVLAATRISPADCEAAILDGLDQSKLPSGFRVPSIRKRNREVAKAGNSLNEDGLNRSAFWRVYPAQVRDNPDDKDNIMGRRLSDNEEVAGLVEFYDAHFIRLTRPNLPNLFLFKHDIKYLFEA